MNFNKSILIGAILIIIVTSLILVLPDEILARPQGKPDIIIIVGGLLRPSHITCYGYEHINTEAIDGLAKNGTLFENAYCSVPGMYHGYASILSGKYGGSIVTEANKKISLDISGKTLTQYLSGAGYENIAVVSDPFLAVVKGFEKYFDRFNNVVIGLNEKTFTNRHSIVTQKAIDFFDKMKIMHKPVFMLVEYSIPAPPYFIFPKDFNEDMGDFPYDKQVVMLDREIANLLKGLRKSGLNKDAIIIFTSSMGASLYSHDEPANGLFVYDTTMKVPLIMDFPDVRSGERRSILASHIDIMPTILNYLKIDYNAQEIDGRNILEKKDDSSNKSRSIYLEALSGYQIYGFSPVVALIANGYKYIELPRPELYNLKRDPNELKNIVDSNKVIASNMKKELLDFVSKKRPQLASIIDKGIDPKDKIERLKAERIEKDYVQSRIMMYRKTLESDPRNREANYGLAKLYADTGELDKAKALLEELTKIDPYFARAWEELGIVYSRMGNDTNAIKCYEKAISISHDLPVAVNNLAMLYEKNVVKSDEVEKLMEKSPKMTEEIRLTYGKAENEYKAGHTKEARGLIEKTIDSTSKIIESAVSLSFPKEEIDILRAIVKGLETRKKEYQNDVEEVEVKK